MRIYQPIRGRSNTAATAPSPLPPGPVPVTPAIIHNFCRIPVISCESFPDEAPSDDPELIRTNGPNDGGLPVGGAPDGGVPADGGARASSARPTLATSGDSYVDTAAESHKNISFNVTVPSGVTPGDYALVNKVQGSARNGAGTPFKAVLYGRRVDSDFATPQVDSVDSDPVYWSTATARWNYTSTGTGFSATDDPGPARSSMTGAIFALNFSIGLYRLSDVPTTTTGTISATPLSEVGWKYSVVVDSAGHFTHPAI